MYRLESVLLDSFWNIHMDWPRSYVLKICLVGCIRTFNRFAYYNRDNGFEFRRNIIDPMLITTK